MKVADTSDPHIAQLRVRLQEQITNIEVSTARYDAGWPAEANRLAVAVRVLVHDTKTSRSLLKQLGAKDRMRWIDANGGRDARRALVFSSLVVFQLSGTDNGSKLSILPLKQSDILERGMLLNFDTWWKIAPVMVGNGQSISRSDVVDMLANQDGGAHVDIKKSKFIKLLRSVPVVSPFVEEGAQGASFGLPGQENDDLAREILRAAMRTIAEEVWLGWNNQLDLLDPDWRTKEHKGGRIGPNDSISGLRTTTRPIT